MDGVPLFAHRQPDDLIAYQRGNAICAASFLADIARLTAVLPGARHILLACQDRYHFAVGFAASLLSGRVSLLPSTQTADVIRQLRRFAPDAICLTDDPACAIDLPRVLFPTGSGAGPDSAAWSVPRVPADRLAAYVFTSGSTGAPIPHAKTWGPLVRCVKVEAERMGLAPEGRRAIVATVPPQHMYGLESSVLVALHSGNTFCAERPFFPADIAAALAALPAPRVLVSTPVHLRTLVAANVDLPPVELILSATAPLSTALAAEVEARYAAPLLEIYGSTETGQIASRRTTSTDEWRLWPGVRLTQRDGQAWVDGGHVEAPTPMGDILEVQDGDRFRLHGRAADLVNVAGKRSSLAFLNHQLMSIPGVMDGAFFLQEEGESSGTGIARMGALVVAPTLDAVAILGQLRERLDPAFLPRPLLIVPEISRNATGKLPRQVLETLVARNGVAAERLPVEDGNSIALSFPADHAAFAGHFPGNPIVPGVLLLDESLRSIAAACDVAVTGCTIVTAKFPSPARPGEELRLRFAPAGGNRVRFTIQAPDRVVALGSFSIPGVAQATDAT
jgi:3-hydroxymyristoyl/3-hydroxydecanoyl-(acyl carrier protein) dehydratase